jgi:hypothetical protein
MQTSSKCIEADPDSNKLYTGVYIYKIINYKSCHKSYDVL